MAVGTIAAVIAAGAAAASTGYALSGAGTPAQPNLASSSAALSNAEASMLPIERQLAGAAATGGTVTNPGYKQIGTEYFPVDSNGNITGKPVPASVATTDFSQFGGAQTQAALAEQNAGDQLALAQKYDPAFIQSALQQEQLADPNSVTARAQENKLIQQQISNPIINPVAPKLESQIGEQVAAGKGLDSFDTGVLNDATAKALAARGGQQSNADFVSPLTTGLAGDQRQLAGIQAGQNELASGSTPEDIQYRQQQQNLANLSAEISGQTPTSEFSSLSNASRGPNPTTAGAPLPTMTNPLQTAGNAALTTQQQQEGQANNWMAGLSTVLNATGALGAITNNTGVK